MWKVNKLYYDFHKLDQTISKKANLLWYNKVEFLCEMWFWDTWETYYRSIPKHKKYIPLSNKQMKKIEHRCWIKRKDYFFDIEKYQQESQKDNHSAFSSQ